MDAHDELRDQDDARWGDPRRCSDHGFPISSPDGLFDAPCPGCEAEAEAEDEQQDWDWRPKQRHRPKIETFDDTPF